MNKTLLVAQREFVENLRTKTFWLGILSFPIIIVAFVFISRLLQDSKDTRSYAVVDHSGWLAAEIEGRSSLADFQALLGEGDGDGDGAESATALAERLQRAVEELPDDHPMRAVLALVEKYSDRIDSEKLASGDRSAFPPEMFAELRAWTFRVMSDPKKVKLLRNFASDISMSDYRRLEFDDLGDDAEKALNKKIDSGELFAYFVIGPDPVVSDEGSLYVSNNTTDSDLRNWFARHATEVVRNRRIAKLELSPEDARSIRASFEFGEQKIDSETGEAAAVTTEEKASNFAPVAFVYLLWIAVFTAAQMLLTNTVEEKSNRLIEVLLSSVSPMQLMAGKVLGIAATGLTIVLSWVLSALIGTQFITEGAFGGVDLVAIIGDPLYLGSFIAYFLAGYLLYAAMLVAIGSVCNSLKEAQNLMQPVFIVLIVPLIAMMFVVQDPNGAMARVLTYIPLFTPFLMMNRAAGPPPTWEYVVSTLVILVSLYIAFLGAAKIFRVGILMTGKPPKLREILRWLRSPVGAVQVRSENRP